MEQRLGLQKIINYANITPDSRSILEAECILNASHIIAFGITKESEDCIEILALCLSTSNMTTAPHEITGKLWKKSTGLEIGQFQCKCVAGLGICKHQVATLLLCNRYDLNEADHLSSTDVKCLWAEKSFSVKSLYTPVPVTDFCHVTYTNHKGDSTVTNPEETLAKLIEICPDSALATHSKGRRRTTIVEKEPLQQLQENTKHVTVLAGLSEIETVKYIRHILETPLPITSKLKFETPEHADFYHKEIDVTVDEAVDISMANQLSAIWRKERVCRITASRCYELFTYTRNNANWPKKINTYVNDPFKGNENTRYGRRMEKEALCVWKEKNGKNVATTGLLIHPGAPWLAYSPDGIQIEDDGISLIEIKCPTNGQANAAADIIQTLEYLMIDKFGKYALKPKHKYYGQVQLGLYLTNCTTCHFIIYAAHDKQYVKIEVGRNEKFLKDLIPALESVFIKRLLPFVAES